MPELLNVRAAYANGADVNKTNPFFDSPGSNSLDSLPLDVMKTFESSGSSKVTFDSPEPATEPVSPPKIKRTTGITFPDLPPVEKVSVSPCDSSTWATSVTHSEAPSSILKTSKPGKTSAASPSQSDSTWATDITSKKSKENKVETITWEMSSTFRKKIKGMKKIIPKMIQAMNGTAPKKVDLTALTVATLCLMPRNGVGMEDGRKCFERMRTSLMLHLIQQQGNGSWVKQDASKYEGEKATKQKGQIAKLNNLLYDCISDKKSSFAEKTEKVSRCACELNVILLYIIISAGGLCLSFRLS